VALQQLTARVHVETEHLGSNNGIVDGGAGELVLVDAPHRPTDARRWADTVAQLGTPKYLINTDHHPDHTIGNRWLGGTVVAHELTRSRLVEAAPTREYLRDLFAVIDADAVALVDDYEVRLAEITFSQRLELWVGDRHLELIHAPGHTANTVMVHVPDEGVLFTGDDVCNLGLPAFLDATVEHFFDAIDQADGLAFEHLVPGHGAPGGRELLERYRELGRELVGRVADAQGRGETREECSARIRFEDLIHRGVGGEPGYPEGLIEHFQQRSIEQVFDDLEADPSLTDR
jgi:cyclase